MRAISALAWPLAGCLLVGCLLPSDGTIPAYRLRQRLRDVSVGQSIDEVHAILGSDPVRKPNHPDSPIPSPSRVIQLVDAEGRRIRVETYVIDTWRAEGCPDFHYRDVPVTFVEGRVAGLDWQYLEWSWQRFGGSLAELRAAQDRFHCPEGDPPADGP